MSKITDEVAALVSTRNRLHSEVEALDLAALAKAIEEGREKARAARVEAAIKGTLEARAAAEEAVAKLDAALEVHAAAEEDTQVARAALRQVEEQLRRAEAAAQAERIADRRAQLAVVIGKGRDQAAAIFEAALEDHLLNGGASPDFAGMSNIIGAVLPGTGDGFQRVHDALARAGQRVHQLHAGLELSK